MVRREGEFYPIYTFYEKGLRMFIWAPCRPRATAARMLSPFKAVRGDTAEIGGFIFPWSMRGLVCTMYVHTSYLISSSLLRSLLL